MKVSHPNEITKVKKSLVETNGKYGFDLKNIRSHSDLSTFFNEMARVLPHSPLATTGPIDGGGITPLSPLTTTQVPLVT